MDWEDFERLLLDLGREELGLFTKAFSERGVRHRGALMSSASTHAGLQKVSNRSDTRSLKSGTSTQRGGGGNEEKNERRNVRRGAAVGGEGGGGTWRHLGSKG